ncbi:MAG: hypothetical protein ACR2NZ_16210 [Rubripirellula sp.]
MVFTKRLIRSGLVAASLAAGLMLAAPAPLTAQEKPQSQGGGAALGATEPVLIVTLGSINKLMQDINYISGAVGQPQAGGMFGMMAGTFTNGIDTTQPIGILVPLVNGAPKPIALIPTADVKTVLKRLEAQTGPVDELDDGTLAITVGASMVFIRQQGNWAVLASERDLLSLAPNDPLALFEGMGNDYDLALRLKMQQVPAETRSTLTAQIRQGFEQAMARQSGGDAEAAREMAETSMAQFEQLINDTDELRFGFNIDQSGKRVVIDGSFTAVPGSKLASIYGGQHAIPSQFSSVIRNDAAAFYHAATSISQDAVEQSRTSIDNSLATVRSALDKEDSLSPQQRADINEMIDRVADLSVKSISEGRADMGALLLADESNFRFVFGSFVADGNEAAQIVKDLAAKVENEPKAPRFKFDQSNYKGVTMHVVEAEVPEREDEARRVFGETLRVHVGTGPKAVYLAVGDKSEELMKQLIDDADKDNSADRPVGQLRLTLMPILAYAQSIEANDALGAMIDALARAPDQGEMTLVQENIANGQEITTQIGEGLLQAIGAALRQAQQAKMQGGQF